MRPSSRHTIGHRMKLHLRVRKLGQTTLRILTPRPGTRVQFATNRFHETWHILSDQRGSKLFAHLLWGLAYQRHPGTVGLIDTPFLRPNPFDATHSDPVLVVPTALTHLNHATLRLVAAARRHLASPDRTVRWHSWGLGGDPPWHRHLETNETFRRIAGMLVLRADPYALKCIAHAVAQMDPTGYGSDHTYFAVEHRRKWGVDGEVQIFTDFVTRLRDAKLARKCLGFSRRSWLTESDQERIWREVYAAKRAHERSERSALPR